MVARHDGEIGIGTSQVIVDAGVNIYRVLLMVCLAFQLVIIRFCRLPLREYLILFTSLGSVAIFAAWWISTYRMINALETPSYQIVEHKLFLAGSTIGDILAFACIAAVMTITLRRLIDLAHNRTR